MNKNTVFFLSLIFFVCASNAIADHWGSQDNPTNFGAGMEFFFSRLPRQGEAANVPWTASYWPTYESSRNMRSANLNFITLPLKKYEKAFGETGRLIAENPDLVDSILGKWLCGRIGPGDIISGQDNDGDSQTDGLGDHDGVDSWWGLCNAWTAASVLYDEPVKPVKYEKTVFRKRDIKTLLILSARYSPVKTIGGGGWYLDNDGNLANKKTNAGAFFVVVTNMLGLRKKSFAQENMSAFQMFNRPVRGYRILKKRQLTEYEALDLLGYPEKRSYSPRLGQPNIEQWHYIKMRVYYVSSHSRAKRGKNLKRNTYELIIEVDEDGFIIGGEWVGKSRHMYPDFLWIPEQSDLSSGHFDCRIIKKILEISTAESDENINEMTKADLINAVANPGEPDND